MTSSQGKFVWYELMTTHMRAAEAFYKSVLGWGAHDSGMSGMNYTMFTAGEIPVGGLMAVPQDALAAGARPAWVGYIAVDDVDAAAEQVKEMGGAVCRAPADIPTVGRFAIISDSGGAMVALFRGADGSQAPAVAPDAPGHVGWRELLATDREAAFDFYSKLVGWTKADALDMGPMGIYQLYAREDQTLGGMMTKPASVPASFWIYYFNVADFDAASERIRSGGGQIVNGPHQVPGGSWIVQALDPQGAFFALVGSRA